MRQRAVVGEQLALRGVGSRVIRLAVRAGRREVHLHDRRDARADGRGAVGVARALAVPGREDWPDELANV